MNFEAFEFDEITKYAQLYNYIKNKMTNPQKKYYIILDEVQQVESWEKAINSFLVDSNVDIYITGSNAYLLSSELSTLLSGRYVEIKMLPLSFNMIIDKLGELESIIPLIGEVRKERIKNPKCYSAGEDINKILTELTENGFYENDPESQ